MNELAKKPEPKDKSLEEVLLEAADIIHGITSIGDGITVTPCGSFITCSPPHGHDVDFLVLVRAPNSAQKLSTLVSYLGSQDFQWEGDTVHYQDVSASNFMSWRNGMINFIVTSNEDFAAKHKVATALCKKLNLLIKEDRIAVFQAVLYGKESDK